MGQQTAQQNLTPEEEAAVLKAFLEQAREGGILVIGQIKHDLEEALGRPNVAVVGLFRFQIDAT